MTRRYAVIAALVSLILAGCRGLAPGASGSPESSVPAEPPQVSNAGDPTASVGAGSFRSASACSLGIGIAEHRYGGLRDLARFSHGVAVAEVVAVGEVQYSTETGERPSCEYLAAANSVFGVGRLVELQVQTPIAGVGERGETVTYMFPGGSLGGDTSPGHHYGLGVPAAGERVLILLAGAPIDVDGGPGNLEVDVIEMFAMTRDGRVVTPDPGERPTIERVRELVRGVVQPAPPER